MKKRRILALIAALLCLCMCFVACKKDDEDPAGESTSDPTATQDTSPIMEQIFNPAWKPEGSFMPTAATKVDLTGNWDNYSENLVISETTNDDGNKVQTVLSLVTGTVLNTFTDTTSQYTDPDNTDIVYNRELTHHIYAPNSLPFYAVLSVYDKDVDTIKDSVHSGIFDTDVEFDNETDNIELSIKLYSLNAAEALATIDDSSRIEDVALNSYYGYQDFEEELKESKLFGAYDSINDQSAIVFDHKTYDMDLEEKTITLRAEGLNVLSEKYYDVETKDNYIYYNLGEGNVTFMDKNFKTLYAYSAPFDSEIESVNVLNNGSVLVQYSTRLPDGSNSYDYIQTGTFTAIEKYDLTSVILKPNQTTTEVEIDYIVSTVWTAYELSELYEGDYLAEGVENLATISYVNENGYIEYNIVDQDVVILDNDADIVKSIKLLHNQNGIPQNLGNGIYQITTATNSYYISDDNYEYVYEYVLTNAKGEEIYTSAISHFNSSNRYYPINDVIYDVYTSKAVYDLAANKAELVAIYDNSFIVYIYNETDGVTSYYKVTADETKLLGVMGGSNPTISDVTVYAYFYAIKALDTGHYTYYNENDVAITGMPELSDSVFDITYNENCVAVYESHWDEETNDTVYNYYIIK